MLVSEALEFLLPMPVYLVGTLFVLAWLGWRRSKSPGRPAGQAWLVVLALWAWLCSTPAISDAWLRSLEGPAPASLAAAMPRNEQTLIVVLGSGEMWSPSGNSRARLDQSGWERVHAAVGLWRQTGGQLLFTGGPGGEAEASLAGAMAQVAAELGVPPERIRLNSASSSTFEDLQLARDPIRLNPGPVWLVTSAVHMPRALGVARRLGLSMQPLRVNYRQILDLTWTAWLPHNRGPERFALVLHEVIGRSAYQMFGKSD